MPKTTRKQDSSSDLTLSEERGVIPSPKSAKEGASTLRQAAMYVMLTRCLAWMVENGTTQIAPACEALGYTRDKIYEAFTDPWVVAQIDLKYRTIFAVTLEQIAENWNKIIQNQIDVATNPEDKRASTTAARFLFDQLTALLRQIEERQEKQAPKERTRVDALMDELLHAGGGRVSVTAEVNLPTTVDPAD
jgi:hypothetical protein